MSFQPPLAGLEELFDQSGPIPGTDLRNFPAVPREVLSAHAKWIGRAGELLVESVFLRMGLVSVTLPEFSPADSIVYHSSASLRVQIKTCSKARAGAFHFSISKGYQNSPTGVQPYQQCDFDLLALVALSENVVKFTVERRQSQSFSEGEVSDLRAYPRRSFDDALDAMGCTSRVAIRTASKFDLS